MNEPYTILLEGAEAETELKKSRFIAHAASVSTEEEAREFIDSIKKEFYDARHNCYAYIIGKDADRVKYSDDGEPAQTAGLPIFNVLKESGIRNCCIVVTRYFGGTLLGAGPLARMYAEAAKLSLTASKTAVMRYGVEAQIEAGYSESEKIKRYLEKNEIYVSNTVYSANVFINVRVAETDYERMSLDIVSLTASNAKISKISDAYFIDTKM